MSPIQIAGLIVTSCAIATIAWPIVREGRAFFGKRRPVRTSVAGLLLIAGAVALLAPKLVADGLWILAPDRCLIASLDDETEIDHRRLNLLKRRMEAGAISDAERATMLKRAAVRLSTSSDPAAWQFVNAMLDGVDVQDESLIDAWIDGLDHEALGVREAGAYALGTFLPDESRCAPALADATHDGVKSVRAISAWALRRYAEDESLPSVAIDALRALLIDPEANVRYQAAEALAFVLDAPEDVLPQLIEGLNSVEPFTRARAANAIGRLGPVATPALDVLQGAQLDPDGSVSTAATNAIMRITSHASAD